MPPELTLIIKAFLLGLSGLVPGPLFTLVVTESLKNGIKEGIKVALSPLITDTPIILITVLVFSGLKDLDHVLGCIAFSGSIFLIYLSWESILFTGPGTESTGKKSRSVKKGIIVNLLNPSPYIFWFSIGAPIIVNAFNEKFIYAVLFLTVFYVTLVGSKIIIAVITGKSKNFLGSRYYIYLIKFLGVVLLVFALFFIKSGLEYFRII